MNWGGGIIFSIHDAVVWGDNFVFPSDVHTRDFNNLVLLEFDLFRFVQLWHSEGSHIRLSVENIRLSGGEHRVDEALLCEMAEKGVSVLIVWCGLGFDYIVVSSMCRSVCLK